MTGYIYIIEDTISQKLYIGSHKGHTTDGYICSSKLVMEQIKLRPDDFKKTIVAIGKYEDMIRMESVLLKKVNAAKHKLFYNQHNGDGKFYCKGRTIESIEKSRQGILGKPLSEQHKLSIKKSLIGRTLSKTHIKNMKKGINARYVAMTIEEKKAKYGTPHRGKPSYNRYKKWYRHPLTNETKMLIEGTEPTGFILGRGKIKS